MRLLAELQATSTEIGSSITIRVDFRFDQGDSLLLKRLTSISKR